ncbi:MAG TPA: zinc-ribbon domain-containing protein [Terriglobales bacterium]|nr:zinc-ribbon domain-containing protein [Terriglobales bacterium]
MRCPRCTSENPPEYRFCGMCGTPLDKPLADQPAPTRAAEPVRPAEPPRVEPASSSISGPSFLGLSGEPQQRGTSRDVSYLLDDEQPKRTYWRFITLLIIIGVVGGLGWLQYKHAGKGWTPPWENQKPTTPVQASQTPPEQTQPAATQQATNPPSQQPAPVPANGAAQPPQGQGTPGNPPQPKESDLPPTRSTAATAANQQPGSQPSANPPAQAALQPSSAAPQGETDKSASAQPPASADENASDADTTEALAPKKPAKPARVKPAPVASPDDALVANAEKYLYGRGVPQNCDRALSSLRAAANRENVRARSLMGTMYATGHCVPKDLPNAYRWFAMASRQQADNMWIQRNLEMIWREMTPQERQLAMARSQ